MTTPKTPFRDTFPRVMDRGLLKGEYVDTAEQYYRMLARKKSELGVSSTRGLSRVPADPRIAVNVRSVCRIFEGLRERGIPFETSVELIELAVRGELSQAAGPSGSTSR